MILRILSFLLTLSVLAYFDVRRVSKTQDRRSFWFCLGLFGAAGAIGLLFFLGVRLPSPIVPFEKVFPLVGKWMGDGGS